MFPQYVWEHVWGHVCITDFDLHLYQENLNFVDIHPNMELGGPRWPKCFCFVFFQIFPLQGELGGEACLGSAADPVGAPHVRGIMLASRGVGFIALTMQPLGF